MKKATYILGTGLSHDGSTCLMKDGKIVVAIEKERLTRIKHDGFNDNLTIQYCLDCAGITFRDIDLIVEKNTINPILKKDDIEKRAGRLIPQDIPRISISHHLAHAYSAIGTSPFDDLGVVVMDGQGSSLDTCLDVPKNVLSANVQNIEEPEKYKFFEHSSYYLFENGKISPIFKDFSEHVICDHSVFPLAPNDMRNSMAELYGGAARYVFGEDFCEGKMMGLAPYGRTNQINGGDRANHLFKLENNSVAIDYQVIKTEPWGHLIRSF